MPICCKPNANNIDILDYPRIPIERTKYINSSILKNLDEYIKNKNPNTISKSCYSYIFIHQYKNIKSILSFYIVSDNAFLYKMTRSYIEEKTNIINREKLSTFANNNFAKKIDKILNNFYSNYL